MMKKYIKWFEYSTWMFFSCAILFYLSITVVPTISLNGLLTLELNLGDHYQEEGAKVHYRSQDLKDQLEITGTVDSSRIGTYQIYYQLPFHNKKIKKTRTIHVVDKTPPVLTLKDEAMFLCPNHEWKEPGYQAIDEYDGDLTDQVIVTKEDNTIIYTVSDHSNNQVSKKRTIITDDQEKPNLTLKGNTTMTLYTGQPYQEPGYEIMDNCDTDIAVNVAGTVDSNTPGTYQLTYTAQDKMGNVVSVTRTVIVKKIDPSWPNTIYLTFDDGPSSNITPGILTILKEENVKATFFVAGYSNNTDFLIRREMEEGHTVALHTTTHQYQTVYASENSYFKDLQAIQDRVYQITGKKSNIIRFPGGSSNTVSRFNYGIMSRLTKEVEHRGFSYFDWNVDSNDAGGAKTSEQITKNVVNMLSHNRANVVLMHDSSSKQKTLDALRSIIRYGKEQGYQFSAITDQTAPIHHGVNN